MADEHPSKRCPKCDTLKPVSEFGVNRNAHDNLTSRCRTCLHTYQKTRRLTAPKLGRSMSSGLGTLTRKAMAAEHKIVAARAARNKVAAEQKALAAEVLAPALGALKAATTALESLMMALKAAASAMEILMGSPVARKSLAKSRGANGTILAHPKPATPPPIRDIKTILAHDRVTAAEAKRIQEAEIVARAEWRPAG
jgi:hypothetical protein